jgi:hypothetical protein
MGNEVACGVAQNIVPPMKNVQAPQWWPIEYIRADVVALGPHQIFWMSIKNKSNSINFYFTFIY